MTWGINGCPKCIILPNNSYKIRENDNNLVLHLLSLGRQFWIIGGFYFFRLRND